MSTPRDRTDCLVLDGGVLTEWLCARYEARGSTWPSKFQRHFLQLPHDLPVWERVLRQYAGKLYMSAYAIAEVQRHVRDGERANRDRAAFRSACWRAMHEALDAHPMIERHILWTGLDEALLHEYGPADASLTALAQHLTSQGKRPCIVTSDSSLRIRCQRDLQILARDPYELLAPAMQ
jgi:hypothetical protein